MNVGKPKPPRMTPEMLARAVELQEKGWTLAEISADVGISVHTLSKRLSKLNADVYARMVKNAAAKLGRQATHLEWMASQASRAWLKSLEDAVTIKTTPDGIETTVKGQSGDASKLREARELLAAVRDVLGIDPRFALERAKVEAMLGDPGIPVVRDVLDDMERRGDELDREG